MHHATYLGRRRQDRRKAHRRPVLAAELDPLPAIELRKFCVAYGDDARGNDAQACATYLRGFIDGSVGEAGIP